MVGRQYDIPGDCEVGFALAGYDPSQPLVIDPVTSSTRLISALVRTISGDDEGHAIAVDGAGNAYVTGYTDATGFPTLGPLQPASTMSKPSWPLDPTGSALVYSTLAR